MGWKPVSGIDGDGHTHLNMSVLDAFTDAGGDLLYNGLPIVADGHTHANATVLDGLTDSAGELHYKGFPINTVITSISATNVNETSTRQFISATEKAQIGSATTDLASHSQRIATLEAFIAQPPASGVDEKVKVNAADTAGYLDSKVDGLTIIENGNKLMAINLSGLLATIHELNQMQGITGNVQAQINALSSIGNFTGSVPTYADIALQFPVPTAGDMVIVVTDETQMGDSTIYVHNGTDWAYSGKFTATIRDFTTHPLNLDTETTSILPKSKYEKQNAAETTITDTANNFASTNVEDALAELFLFASSFKQSVVTAIGSPLVISDTRQDVLDKIEILKQQLAMAITNKGVPTFGYNTLSEMATKVAAIPNTEIVGMIKRTAKLNITAPYTQTVVLDEPLSLEQVAATVLAYVGNNVGVVHYKAEYNNGDETNFTFAPNTVTFDGFMRNNDKWQYSVTEIKPGAYYETEEIDFSVFSDIGKLDVDTTSLTATLHALKLEGAVVKASGDISLAGVESIDTIALSSVVTGSGIAKVAMSFDGGMTYKAYTGGLWVTVDVNDKADFKTNGMTEAVMASLDNVIIDMFRNGSDLLRFAYYVERADFASEAKHDSITVTVSMQGHNVIADTANYKYEYDQSTKTLTFNFTKSGTYSITYVDGQ